MSEKRNTPGFAEKLSEAQRDELCKWLVDHTYEQAAERVAQDPPEGFGIKVSVATIGRFALEFGAIIADLSAQRMAEKLDHYKEASCSHDIYFTAEVDDATTNAIREQVFQIALQPNRSSAELHRLARTCLALRKLQSSQPSRGAILMKRESNQHLEVRCRAELAKKYGPPDDNDYFPIEIYTSYDACVSRKIEEYIAKQNNDNNEAPSQAA